MNLYQKYFKRLLDIILSLAAIIILSPIMLLTAVLVRLKLGSPVLFIQPRPGRNGRIFQMYKFRTMIDAFDEKGEPLPDPERETRFGNKLRSTSLDELPELFNILRGDMSIVGPRPLLVDYLPLYTAQQKQRHNVRPGLTGLAQVKGRNATTWDARFNYDIEYVRHVSFGLDVKIILMTVKTVISREGISAEKLKHLGVYLRESQQE